MQKIDFNKANIINNCDKFLLALSSYIFAKTAPIKTALPDKARAKFVKK
jgi:hypothetical protein